MDGVSELGAVEAVILVWPTARAEALVSVWRASPGRCGFLNWPSSGVLWPLDVEWDHQLSGTHAERIVSADVRSESEMNGGPA